MKKNIDGRIRAALAAGPLSSLALAEILWPHDACPKAWRYQTNGGPSGWVLPMGKAIKRMGLNVQNKGPGPDNKIISLPMVAK